MKTLLAAAAMAALAGIASAAPPPGADPALHAWFERQHSVHGLWCCDVSDGHILGEDEWRMTGGAYQVLISGQWHDVPMEAMRDPLGGPNPTGHAIAWYTVNSYGVHIFCFAPGFEG